MPFCFLATKTAVRLTAGSEFEPVFFTTSNASIIDALTNREISRNIFGYLT